MPVKAISNGVAPQGCADVQTICYSMIMKKESEPKPSKPGPKPETLSLHPLTPKQVTKILLHSKPAEKRATRP